MLWCSIALPWYAYVQALMIVMLTKYVSVQIRERKAKKKQAQDDTIPLVDMDLEKSMPPALEEGQKWPKYPQPAVVDQRPDALSCGPWVPVYLGGCRLQGYEGRVVRH